MAKFAELNVKRCRYGHDCHNTPQVLNSGQNINYEVSTGLGSEYEPLELFIEDTINFWWNERDLAKHGNIDKCCGSSQISNFLQMASDKTSQVGCAIVQFTESEQKITYIVCNYSYGITVNEKVYKVGGPASKCTLGRNRKFPALCNVHEMIDINE